MTLSADRLQLGQLLFNLLKNACDATAAVVGREAQIGVKIEDAAPGGVTGPRACEIAAWPCTSRCHGSPSDERRQPSHQRCHGPCCRRRRHAAALVDVPDRIDGLRVQTFDSAENFLQSQPEPPGCLVAWLPGCLVLDVRMPSMSGLDLQQAMQQRCIELPIIFITGHADVSLAVQAMKQGAVEFLE